MKKPKMTWFGDEFKKKAEERAIKNLERVGYMATNDIKTGLSQSKAPPHSKPGDIPHLLHGELARSMTHEVDERKKIVRVGTNKFYGKLLELGSSKMKKRPFLRPIIRKNIRKYRNIMEKK
ncbi:hypothetical protein Pla110_32940 [Polystyrenella longa]|uniref:Phage protein, HK97 gp10 family n=1 Tax=Polystyrenella longa TaxID=2528007 RepID=A0A518CQP3_9PLAN|nr:HK97-gp10 family putative phage morphogenesis protein [Polystyrenella longa]QDU81552.1 hypothetical protein Pla110_32940 [Polystyrenella longa]